jgi:RimJ/RimL family protein N-acetyltransferase
MADIMGLTLQTEELTIRSLSEADWAIFLHLNTDAEVMKHVGSVNPETEVKALFEQRLAPWEGKEGQWLSLAIEHSGTGEVIGLIGLKVHNLETGIVEIGFMLDMVQSGKGYGTQALSRFVKYAFYNLGFHKVTATCSIYNIASQRALEKNGFLKEGILRHNAMVDDHYIDDCIYGLLAQDVV